VVAEDELVALAVERVAVGAVGGEPDAVAEAVPVDDPADRGAGARGAGPADAGEHREEREREGDVASSGQGCISSTEGEWRSRGYTLRTLRCNCQVELNTEGRSELATQTVKPTDHKLLVAGEWSEGTGW